ncbi:Uncharacterised protein [Vibrio cholerae]|nr:Uncharacterised protein [Vibrio cholerae]
MAGLPITALFMVLTQVQGLSVPSLRVSWSVIS